MNIPFSFHSSLVVRTPRYPFRESLAEEDFEKIIRDSFFLESLFLASAVLYHECIKHRNGEMKDQKDIHKLRQSVIKYFTRSYSRCTPFGLFSGCGISYWVDSPSTQIIMEAKLGRHTRLDMNYLCALAQHLESLSGIKDHFLYFPNSSIYNIGDEIRYIEYNYFGGKRIHQISSVSDTDYLEQLLTKGQSGISIQEMVDLLSAPDIAESEVELFIHELLAAQLFVSELEPAITGDEFTVQILSVLKRIYTATLNDGILDIVGILESVNRMLSAIDSYAETNVIETYQQIMTLLNKLGVAYEESKLFQVDMIREVRSGGVSKNIQEKIVGALALINRFGGNTTHVNLQAFSKKFYERYEDREMPLLEVLDTETGIGYLDIHSEAHSPLTEDIVLPLKRKAVHSMNWTPLEKYLIEKISDAYKNNKTEVELKEEELLYLKNESWDDLPPSMSVMFRIIDPTKELIMLENTVGSSAANLLGRFAHADERIKNLVSDITAKEQQANKDIALAEIVHLPESRVGNILLHPAFREYEIPYLAKSSLPPDKQIRVKDIMISVRQESITLRCMRTNKIIIPRLSNAHNYQHNALPVYQFLCDLQNQNLRGGLTFHWGVIKLQFKYLPRVIYDNTILSPASWQLLHADLSDLQQTKAAELEQKIKTFVNQWKLPQYVVLADGDNELLIDFENRESVRIWLDMIKNRPGIELKEFIIPVNAAVGDEQHLTYNNQFVASLIKDKPTYMLNGLKKKTPLSPQKSFTLGSEWLYYKIYCGVKSADKLLLEVVAPVIRKLQNEKKINNFFFIRYNDPSFHIRFRMQLSDCIYCGEIIQLVHDYANDFIKTGHIWKIQTDTYNREYDRYGENMINLAESIFHHDSEAVLDMLDKTWGDEREKIRWLWTIRNVDELLNNFDYSLIKKRKLLETLKDTFAKEFNADKFLKNQLNNKYRQNKKEIERLLDRRQDSTGPMSPIIETLSVRSEKIKPIAGQLIHLTTDPDCPLPLDNLLSSYIHMLINRAIPAKQRLHEMVIYDFLYRQYHSAIAREAVAPTLSTIDAN